MIRIGTSGWSYDHWEEILYPAGTPQAKRLDYYLERYDTVEVNATYYRWPNDTVFAGWRRRLPEHFLMTAKAPRSLTHILRLRAPETWLERIAGGLFQLSDRLGILLVQLSPRFEADPQRLDDFLGKVPRWIRTSVEFRHPSWHTEEVFAILDRHGAAYCVMSGAHLPCILRATAPFVYVRFHGPDPHHLYGGSYSDVDMRWWTDRIREWEGQGRDVWAYFNNDGGGNALRNADALKHFLGV